MKLRGDLMNDYWIDYGADLSESFTFFLRTFDGSLVGVWHDSGAVLERSPVVLVDHEGDLEILGSTVEHFLARLAVDDDLELLRGLEEPGDLEPFRSDHAAWLRSTLGVDSDGLGTLARAHPTTEADLGEWVSRHGDEARRRAADDPVVRAIHAELETLIDHDRLRRHDPSLPVTFVVHCVADHLICAGVDHGRGLPSAEQVERIGPLARQYRRQRAERVPGRGGWFSADFRRYPDGWATPACSFDFPPAFSVTSPITEALWEYDGRRVTAADYRRDLSEFPRSDRWMP